MTSFRFLHAADLHLDSPLRGLARYQGAPVEELQGATRKALQNLVSEAIERVVDFVLIAGDLYDGDWPDYNTGLFFVQQMARLDQAGIRVFAIAGNHDAQSKITKSLRLPKNVVLLSADKPETILWEEKNLAVHGQSFATPSVTEDLSLNYPNPVDGFFNIGLLHTSADGRPGHSNYAPCSVSNLQNHGYDYWALGHIHQREILSSEPWIVFSGNTQGRHAKETGAKSATLVEVAEGKVTGLEEVFTDVARWAQIRVDISGLDSREQFLNSVEEHISNEGSASGGRLLAFRLETVGCGLLHSQMSAEREAWTQEIRALSLALSTNCWLEKVKFSAESPASDSEEMESDILDSLLEGLRAKTEDLDYLQSMRAEILEPLLKKLPREWRESENLHSQDESLQSAARDAIALVDGRLRSSGGET